ncbi:MAG: alpha/beta hydrolase [Acidimicrobiales bacterium]|nr:alpha/beta hydrolase [Acidimicrobiales bacterium]
MASEERRFVRNGLAVIERTVAGAPLIVIVHGAMDRASSFGRVARRLEDVSLLRYDRRGYGRSDPGRPTTLGEHVEDLLGLIDGREALVFGHSFGGTIGLAAVMHSSATIRSLVVYESPVPSVAVPDPFPRGHDDDPGDVAERFMRTMVGDRIWARLPASTKEARRSEGPSLIADFESAGDAARSIDPSRIGVPVVVGAGSDSPERVRERARLLADALPRGSFELVVGAGHGVHLTDPTGTAALLRRALEGSEKGSEPSPGP